MGFDVTRQFVVKAPAAAVWTLLVDPERIARCLPGAAITGQVDDRTWTGTLTVKLGPVQSSYKGKVVFERLDPVERRAELLAIGQDTRGRGGADLRMRSALREIPEGTEVTAISHVNITGILAQMGRGMVQDVSDQLFGVFSQRLRDELEQPAPVHQPPATASRMSAVATAVATPEALDLGAMSSRAASAAAVRAVRNPVLWIVALVLVAAALVRLFR